MKVHLKQTEKNVGFLIKRKQIVVELKIDYSAEERALIESNSDLRKNLLSENYESKNYPFGIELNYTLANKLMEFEVNNHMEAQYLMEEIKDNLSSLKNILNASDGPQDQSFEL